MELRLLRMPPGGLFRVEGRDDLACFPSAPAPALGYSLEPVLDGYRWEDIVGEFSTLKLSRSEVGAVGRAVAGYRKPRRRDSNGLVEYMDSYFTAPADDTILLSTNRIPSSFFSSAWMQRLSSRPGIEFVDVADRRTLDTVARFARDHLRAVGVQEVGVGLFTNRNRRVTAALTRALYDFCAAERYAHVAGLRYPGPSGRPWDAYVMWCRSHGPLLALEAPDVEVRPLSPDDPAVREACAELALEPPDLSIA